MGIGLRLKELRKQNKLKLQEVGDHLGITAAAVSGYEHGTRKPSPSTIQLLAELYKTTADDILGITNENSNFKKILNNNKLHWDGIPLQEDELNLIKQLIELRVKDRQSTQDKKTNVK